MESWLFLGLILVVALVGKNMSLIIATGVVMLLKLIPFSAKYMPVIQAKGINWGVTVISVAILIPIATGKQSQSTNLTRILVFIILCAATGNI